MYIKLTVRWTFQTNNYRCICFITKIIIGLIAGVKKITCPGARDKLNFRQDKQIFSPNVRRTSKKFNACLSFPLTRTSYLVTGQVQILMYLPGGQVNIFRFFYPCIVSQFMYSLGYSLIVCPYILL